MEEKGRLIDEQRLAEIRRIIPLPGIAVDYEKKEVVRWEIPESFFTKESDKCKQ